MRKLIYIDSSYSLQQILDQGLDQVLNSRSLDGYFKAVWSAHPLDTNPLSHPGISACGPTGSTKIGPNHYFISGRYGRFKSLAWLPAFNASLALLLFILKLIGLAFNKRIHVVRAGDPLLCGFIGLIVSRLSGAALVVRVNGDHDWVRATTGRPICARIFLNARVEIWIEKFVLSQAHHVILYCEHHKQFVLSKGAKPNCVTVIRHGNLIDPQHFLEPSLRTPLTDPQIRLMFLQRPWMVHVGRLEEIKHVMDCYEVLFELAKLGLDVGLILVGDGQLRSAISSRANVDGLTERIVFAGNIDQSSLASLLPYCTLALSPVTGRALAEVAFAARPVVAYDLDWQSELIESDATGILVPARDTTAMAVGAARFLADSELCNRLGSSLRAKALNLLDPQKQILKEIEVYSSLAVLQ